MKGIIIANPNSKRTIRRKGYAVDPARLKAVGKALDNAGSGFFGWMTADHNRDLSALIDPPSAGLLSTLFHSLKCLLLSIGATVARTLLLVVLYALWIPILIMAFRWFLLN